MELPRFLVIIQTVIYSIGIVTFFVVLFISLYKWVKRKPISPIVGWCASIPAILAVFASIPYFAELRECLLDSDTVFTKPDAGIQYYLVLLSIGMGLTIILGVLIILFSRFKKNDIPTR